MPRLKWFPIVILVGSLALSVIATAAEEGGEGGEGEGKDGAKSGKAEKGATVLATPEWIDVQSKLQALKAKISGKEKSIAELIQEKQLEKDPRKSHEIVESLKKEHKELETMAAEYEQQRNYYRYRFPEKGQRDAQKYQRVEIKPLESMEAAANLEGHLQHTLHKVRKQYGEADGPIGKEKSSQAVAPKKPENPITEPAVLAK